MIDWHQVAMGGYQALLDQIQAEDLRREARIADLEGRVAELEGRLVELERQAVGCVDSIDGLVEWLRKLDQDDIELMDAGPACEGMIAVGIAAGDGR